MAERDSHRYWGAHLGDVSSEPTALIDRAPESRAARWTHPAAVERRVETALVLLVMAFQLKSVVDLGLELGGVALLTPTKVAGAWFFGNFLLYLTTRRVPLRLGVIHIILVAIIALAVASTPQARAPDAAVVSTLRYASFVALFFALTILLNDPRNQIRTVWALVTSSALAACLALAHFFGGALVATTPYGDPNDTAFLLATTLPLAFWLFAHERCWRPLTLVMIAAISTSVALSLSRGAIVGLAAAVVWQLYVERRPARTILSICLIPILAAALLVYFNPARVRTGLAAKQKMAWVNMMTRLEAWGAATALVVKHPLLGVGPGNFQFYCADVWDYPGAEPVRVVHNTYLEVGAELGVFGLLLFVAYLALTFSRLGAAVGTGIGAPGLAAALRLSLIVAVVAGLFLSEQFFAPFWVLGALGTALSKSDKSDRVATS